MQSDIFISYKRNDKEKVFPIKDFIERNTGVKCWIDMDGIESDAQFANVIIKAINNAQVFLFMYSNSHADIEDYANDWTIREINFAQKKEKRIVFVNIDKTPLTDWFELFFGAKQQVNALSDADMQKLCKDLKKWLNKDSDLNITSRNETMLLPETAASAQSSSHPTQSKVQTEPIVNTPPQITKPSKNVPTKVYSSKPASKSSKWLPWIIGGAVAAIVAVIILAVVLHKSKTDFYVETELLSVPSLENPESFTVNGISFNMGFVEGGTFQMGSDDSDADDSKKPVHSVTVSSFYMGETEVTQALWKAVMGSNPSHFKGDDNRPVESVSWNDCQEFIRKLNQLTGKVFRLPTEAEWEYAARGGNKSQHYKYAGSNSIGNVAWYIENSYDKRKRSPDHGTHPVKGKQANELGLYDMSGNVWEWCEDLYDSYSYIGSATTLGLSERVLRGGAWKYSDEFCKVSFRNSNNPDYHYSEYGFRLALVRE